MPKSKINLLDELEQLKKSIEEDIEQFKKDGEMMQKENAAPQASFYFGNVNAYIHILSKVDNIIKTAYCENTLKEAFFDGPIEEVGESGK